MLLLLTQLRNELPFLRSKTTGVIAVKPVLQEPWFLVEITKGLCLKRDDKTKAAGRLRGGT